MGLHRGRTQHMSLSAAALKTRCSSRIPVPYSVVLTMKCDCICTRRTAQVQTKWCHSTLRRSPASLNDLSDVVTIILKADRPMTPTTRRQVTVQLAIGQRLGVPDAFHLVMYTFNISSTG